METKSYSVETLSIMIKSVMDECKRRGFSDQQIANAIARGVKEAMDDQIRKAVLEKVCEWA